MVISWGVGGISEKEKNCRLTLDDFIEVFVKVCDGGGGNKYGQSDASSN